MITTGLNSQYLWLKRKDCICILKYSIAFVDDHSSSIDILANIYFPEMGHLNILRGQERINDNDVH
jgi:hypothetical protein